MARRCCQSCGGLACMSVAPLCLAFLEFYGIMPFDTPKDASMNCTLLARILDLTAAHLRELGDTYGFPAHLCINVDNTPRESKNSHFAAFLSFLIHKRVFRSICCEYLQVDHTHTMNWIRDSVVLPVSSSPQMSCKILKSCRNGWLRI